MIQIKPVGNLASLRIWDWIEVEKTIVARSGVGSPIYLCLAARPSDLFYAFASALEYSAHKYYPRIL